MKKIILLLMMISLSLFSEEIKIEKTKLEIKDLVAFGLNKDISTLCLNNVTYYIVSNSYQGYMAPAYEMTEDRKGLLIYCEN